MMLKYLICLLLVKVTESKMSIQVITGETSIAAPSVHYSGMDLKVATVQDLDKFQINNEKLKEAVSKLYGRYPDNVYVNNGSELCDCDIYKRYGWEPVTRIISIQSARIKDINKENKILKFENLINNSSAVSKHHSDISYKAETVLKTSWNSEKTLSLSQEIEYKLLIVTGKTEFAYTPKWGQSEEKTRKETIGSTSGVEIELKPGQGVKVELTANTGSLEIEVVYKSRLRGNVVVNFGSPYNRHHFWGPSVDALMKSGGISNGIFTYETIKYNFYVDGSVTITDINKTK